MSNEDGTADAGQQTQDTGASQQSPEGTQDVVSRAELDKVIGERQAAKEATRRLNQQLADMQEKVRAMPDSDTLQAFQEWRKQQDEQAKAQAIEKGDVEALERRLRETFTKQSEAKDAKIRAFSEQLTQRTRDTALLEAETAASAYNPSQVVKLLRERVRMVELSDGTLAPEFLDSDLKTPAFDGSGNRVTDAKAFVNLFLSHPDNANLVRSTARPGPGAKPQGTANRTGKPVSKDEFNALSDDEKARVAATMSTDEIRSLMGIGPAKSDGFL